MQYEASYPNHGKARRAVLAVAIATGLSALLLALPMAAAQAGTFVAEMCQTATGVPIGTAGLTEEDPTSASRVYYDDACAKSGEAVTMKLGPNSVPYSNGQGGIYTYATPPGVTISGYALQLGSVFACGPVTVGCGGGSGVVAVWHTDEHDPAYDFRNLGAGAETPAPIEVSGLHGVNSVTMTASCDAEGGDCAANDKIASFEIKSGRFSLADASVPKVEHVFGPVEGSSAVSGEPEWNFTATDAGAGVYAVDEVVDGKRVSGRVLNENGGLCVDLEPTEAVKAFASPQPCPTEVDGTETLNTNDFADGEHTVRVTVEDAAGDTATVFDGKLETANGPVLESAPLVAGKAQVGSTLIATNGIFSLRADQEWAGAVAGQWERCVSAADCQPISGATGADYVPTAADVGYELAYVSTAAAAVTDDVAKGLVHSTHATSVPTLAVTEASGSTVSCAGGCTTGATGGTGGNGGNGAGSNGGGGGTLTVDLGGLGLTPSANAVSLGSTAAWRVSLRVSPSRVHRHTQIRLSGTVSTAPRPANGKLVYLEARERQIVARRSQGRTRKVAAYGSWITFMALRANTGGAFTATYRFRLGGLHTYQFRAVAPAEGQYRDPTGTSSPVTVSES
jgi:hypothetical protein